MSILTITVIMKVMTIVDDCGGYVCNITTAKATIATFKMKLTWCECWLMKSLLL